MRICSFVFLLLFVVAVFVLTQQKIYCVYKNARQKRNYSFDHFFTSESFAQEEYNTRDKNSNSLEERIEKQLLQGLENSVHYACQVGLVSVAICEIYPNRFCKTRYVALLGLLFALFKELAPVHLCKRS